MKAFPVALSLALIVTSAGCGQAGRADGNNSLSVTSEGGVAPIADDSETANSTTGLPAGGSGADPAAVEGPSAGPGPGDKPGGNSAAAPDEVLDGEQTPAENSAR